MKIPYSKPEAETVLFRALERLATEPTEATDPEVDIVSNIEVGGGVDEIWGPNTWNWSGKNQ